jgi:hypothetical protein
LALGSCYVPPPDDSVCGSLFCIWIAGVLEFLGCQESP